MPQWPVCLGLVNVPIVFIMEPICNETHYHKLSFIMILYLRWMSGPGNCLSWTRWILRRWSDNWGNYPLLRQLTSSDVAAMSSPLVLLHHFDIRLFVVILPFPASLNILIILSGKSWERSSHLVRSHTFASNFLQNRSSETSINGRAQRKLNWTA